MFLVIFFKKVTLFTLHLFLKKIFFRYQNEIILKKSVNVMTDEHQYFQNLETTHFTNKYCYVYEMSFVSYIFDCVIKFGVSDFTLKITPVFFFFFKVVCV